MNEFSSNNSSFTIDERIELFEELSIIDRLHSEEDRFDSQLMMVESLVEGCASLPEDQRKAVESFLSQDPTMDKAIQISTEGQKLQDYFRWGLSGMLMGLYLGSFNRILKGLTNPILNPNGRSQYLLSEKYVGKCLDGCETILTAIKSGKSDNVLKALDKAGFTVDRATDTDWKAVLGSISGRIVGGSVGSRTGGSIGFGFGGIFGLIVGKYASKKVRMTATEHGYTANNFKQHSARICKIINEINRIKTIESDKAAAGPVTKKCMKMVCQGVSTIGRGFVAVTM